MSDTALIVGGVVEVSSTLVHPEQSMPVWVWIGYGFAESSCPEKG